MQRAIVSLALIFICFAALLLLFNSKDAYQILPVQPPKQLDNELDNGWKEYEDEQGNFKVQFPTEPQHAYENVRMPNSNELRLYKVFASETPEGKVFMVSLVTFSPEAYKTGDDVLMHRFINELVTTKENGKLEKLDPTKFKDHTGYDFVINNSKGKMEGVVFMDGKTLVLLSDLIPKGVDSNELDLFKKSFELRSNK